MSSCNYCKYYKPGAQFCQKKHVQLPSLFDTDVILSAPFDCVDFFNTGVRR